MFGPLARCSAAVLVLSACATSEIRSNPVARIAWPPEVGYQDGEAECPRALPADLLSIDGLRPGRGLDDDLADGVRIFGPSPLLHAGDAGASRSWRCWSAANGDGTVVVESTGLGIWWELRVLGPEIAFEGRDQCPRSKKVGRWLATGNGIRLGLARARVESLVGAATKASRGWFERMCFSKQKMTPAESASMKAPAGNDFWGIASWFRGVFAGGRLAGFSIGWSESW